MNNQVIKTDNSYFNEKVSLRLASLKLIKGKDINVLDAFSGDGKLWEIIKNKISKNINVTRIEIKPDAKGVYLKGDNLKYLSGMDLNKYDIIDLDAYGSPFRQLELIFKRKYIGIVHCTFIQTMSGGINHSLLEFNGYSKKMISKCPTLFYKNPVDKLFNYLAYNGIKNIIFIKPTERKIYFYFKTKSHVTNL